MPPRRKPLWHRLRDWLADAPYRFRIFTRELVAPFERVVRKTFERVFVASDRVDKLGGGAVAGLGAALAWPFVVVARLLGGLARLVVPQAVRQAAVNAWRGIGRWQRKLGQGLLVVAQKLNLDGPFLKLVKWTRPLWLPVAAVLGFAQAWLTTRNWKQMLWGLPAILMLLPFAVVLGRVAISGNAGVAGQYKRAVKEALEAEDYARVQLYERKLAQLGVDTQRTDYQTALALVDDDRLDEAYERMQRLAPSDSPGYLPAHYWIVQRLLGGQLDVPADEANALAAEHLEQLHKLRVSGPQFDLLRAILRARQDRLVEAIALLAPHQNQHLFAAIERLRFCLALTERDDAPPETAGWTRDAARNVQALMEDKSRRRETIAAMEYRWWATAELQLGNRASTRRVVLAWQQVDADDPFLKQVLESMYRDDFVRELKLPQLDAARLAQTLLQWAAHAEDPQPLQLAVARLYGQRRANPALAEMFDALVAHAETPGRILETIGTGALVARDWETAHRVLQLAVERMPQNYAAWNNLAWLYSNRPQPDYQAGLEAVERALAINPQDFHSRETRGQLLVRLERWEEAIEDLEYAINQLPDNPDVHAALAQAYRAVGNDDLADIHAARSQP
jgi:tetratricopeptide (TPR) repeat protein